MIMIIKQQKKDLQPLLHRKGIDAYLMYTDSIRSADMYYISGFLAGDAFTYLYKNKDILLVSSMEKERAKKESRITDVRSTSDYGSKELLKIHKDPAEVYSRLLVQLLKEEECSSIAVPEEFPLFFADHLRDEGINITCITSPIRKLREKKTKTEIKAISNTQRACELSASKAIDLIRSSKISGDELTINGRPLTSEYIKAAIHHSLLDSGCEAQGTIVACGPRSCDPHWEGEGVLKAHQQIILDIFPRNMVSRYYSDMSRTVVRGKPDPKIKEMYEAVLAAQQVGFDLIEPGANSSEIHQAVCDSFADAGFTVGEDEGFIHSTGHGVGIDIHERPGIGPQQDILDIGNVITVEPGLYYHDVGGVRIEDMVVVTDKGCNNLTMLNKNLQL